METTQTNNELSFEGLDIQRLTDIQKTQMAETLRCMLSKKELLPRKNLWYLNSDFLGNPISVCNKNHKELLAIKEEQCTSDTYSMIVALVELHNKTVADYEAFILGGYSFAR